MSPDCTLTAQMEDEAKRVQGMASSSGDPHLCRNTGSRGPVCPARQCASPASHTPQTDAQRLLGGEREREREREVGGTVSCFAARGEESRGAFADRQAGDLWLPPSVPTPEQSPNCTDTKETKERRRRRCWRSEGFPPPLQKNIEKQEERKAGTGSRLAGTRSPIPVLDGVFNPHAGVVLDMSDVLCKRKRDWCGTTGHFVAAVVFVFAPLPKSSPSSLKGTFTPFYKNGSLGGRMTLCLRGIVSTADMCHLEMRGGVISFITTPEI
ncbi:hypothetical protein Q8A73_013052 [Channa argus]|nr:hypothetical protein Q8A73_013052 [Channa argus]